MHIEKVHFTLEMRQVYGLCWIPEYFTRENENKRKPKIEDGGLFLNTAEALYYIISVHFSK